MLEGVLNVYKERGYTSHDVVARLRGILKMKKIGHTGTLDPDAEGVLPVCLGQATRLSGMLTEEKKVYRAVMLLGTETDTQDTGGQVTAQRPVSATEEQVRQAVMSFVGEYDQVPPMYSALKVNGQKLYDLARRGKTVERQPRRVVIHAIRIESAELPRVTMTVTCSKGTYIRTLCHDIGQKLGCGACMESLVRTAVGRFRAEDSLRLSEIEKLRDNGELAGHVVSAEQMFDGYPGVRTLPEGDSMAHNGNPLKAAQVTADGPAEDGGQYRLYDSFGTFVGIYRYEKEKDRFRPVRMFRSAGSGMTCFINDADFRIPEPTVVAIGKFDGRHLGHQKLLNRMMEWKKTRGYKTAVFTFYLPSAVRVDSLPGQVITTADERRASMERMGIDYLVEYPFTDRAAHMAPEDFIKEILIGRMNAKAVVAGTDCGFGYKRAGNADLLKSLAGQLGYEADIIEKAKEDQRDISSSYIKEELSRGNMEKAWALLGQPYSFHGTVVHGNHVGGPWLGFPTVNLLPPEEKFLPPFGVYTARVLIGGTYYGGMANIGRKPTVEGHWPVGVETNVFGWDGDLYGRKIEVQLLHFQRPEQKFPSLELLKLQLRRDAEQARAYLEEHGLLRDEGPRRGGERTGNGCPPGGGSGPDRRGTAAGFGGQVS